MFDQINSINQPVDLEKYSFLLSINITEFPRPRAR